MFSDDPARHGPGFFVMAPLFAGPSTTIVVSASCGTFARRPGGGAASKAPVDECMTMVRDVGEEYARLAVDDLSCAARILRRSSPPGLALLEDASFVDNQHRFLISETSDRVRSRESRSASAFHRSRPSSACCRYGSGLAAASARIPPVLRGSLPSNATRNNPAFDSLRSCANSGRIRLLRPVALMPTISAPPRPTQALPEIRES